MISGKPETSTFLGRTKPDSNNSIRSLQLPTFSTNRGVRFSFKDNSNGLKTLDSCTVCLTLGVHSTSALPMKRTAQCFATVAFGNDGYGCLRETGTDRGLLRSVLGPWSPVPKCEAPGAPISVSKNALPLHLGPQPKSE